MKRKKAFFILFFTTLSVAGFFAISRTLIGWGCVRTTGLYASHQYLNRLAYEKLKEHPAFSQSGFPSLSEVQKYAGVDVVSKEKILSPSGEGPDNPDNTRSSWHYYNPERGEGLAPSRIDFHFQNFQKKLLFKKGKQKDSQLDHFPPARDAAYMAHFIQDLTCAFHVLGTNKFNMGDIKPNDLDVIGPFRVFTEDYLKTVAKRCSEDSHKVKGMEHNDWFDPNYYDGPWPTTIKYSTHFYYEVAVEDKYRREWLVGVVPIPQAYADYTYVNRLWDKNITPSGFAKAIARETRARIGTAQNPGELYFPTERLKVSGPMTGPPAWLEVPYSDWWRAVRATYTLWRGSFCALVSSDAKLEKVNEKKDLFRLKVKLEDRESDDNPEQIQVRYEMNGDVSSSGDLSLASISDADENGWVTFDQNIRIRDDEFLKYPRSRNGIIRVDLEGRYPKTPDSGQNFHLFDLSDITHNAVVVPDVQGYSRVEAIKLLQNTPLNNRDLNLEGPVKSRASGVTFQVTADLSKESPKDRYQPDRVAHQDPAPGTWAAPGDEVTIFVYGEYKFTTVPRVLFLSEEEASKLLEKKPLRVEWIYKKTLSENENNLVIDQKPAPNTEVPPNSPFEVTVGKYAKPDEKDEFREKETGFQRQDLEKKEKEEIGFEESGGLILSSLEVHPSSARMNPGQSMILTAVAYDMEGKLVTGERLAGVTFQWYSGDPSVASVFGEGSTAQVNALKTGEVAIHCSTTSQVVAASVIIQRSLDREFTEKSEQFEREELREDEPPFEDEFPFEEEDPFLEEAPLQEEYDCGALLTEFEAAFRSDNIGHAEYILQLADQARCSYVDRAFRLLQRRYDFIFCKSLYAQFAEAVHSRNMALAEALYGQMLEQNCSPELLRLAAERLQLDRELRERRRQFSRDIMQQMQAILGMINRNMGRNRTSPPRRYPREQPRPRTHESRPASIEGIWGYRGQPFCRIVRRGGEYSVYNLFTHPDMVFKKNQLVMKARQISENRYRGTGMLLGGTIREGQKTVDRQKWEPMEIVLLQPDLIEFRDLGTTGKRETTQLERLR